MESELLVPSPASYISRRGVGRKQIVDYTPLVENQPWSINRRWQLQPVGIDSMHPVGYAWQPTSSMDPPKIPLEHEDDWSLPLKVPPVSFTEEQFKERFPHPPSISENENGDGLTWDYGRSIKLAELAWTFDCRFAVIAYHLNLTERQVRVHYARLLHAFSPPPRPVEMETNLTEPEGQAIHEEKQDIEEQNQDGTEEAFFKDLDPDLLEAMGSLRMNLEELRCQRDKVIGVHGRHMMLKTKLPSLPEILQRSIARRTKQKQLQQQQEQHPNSAAQEDKEVIRVSPIANTIAQPKRPEVLIAGDLHWRGLKPNVIRVVEKRMQELGIPLRPVVPSERICALYQQIVTKLSSQPIMEGRHSRRKSTSSTS